MMNDIFNGRRFVRYAVKHYTENWKTYLIGAGGLFILLTLVNGMIMNNNYVEETGGYSDSKTLLYCAVFSFIAGIVVMAWTIQLGFKSFRKRSSQSMALGLPASDPEKYLFAWVNSLVFFWVLYIGIFFLSLAVLHMIYGYPVGVVQAMVDDRVPFLIYLYVLLSFNGCAMFCNAYAKRNPAWAYVTFAVVILIGGYLMSIPVIYRMVPFDTAIPFYIFLDPYVFLEGNFLLYKVSYIHPRYMSEVLFGINTISILFFWIVGYFKFRERQLK